MATNDSSMGSLLGRTFEYTYMDEVATTKWGNGGDGNSSIYMDNIWISCDIGQGAFYNNGTIVYNDIPIISEISDEERKKESERIEKAKIKANELLKDIIGEESYKKFKETGNIEFKTQIGRTYSINGHSVARNICLNDEKGKLRICAHLKDTDIPIEDNLIAQILMIKNSEDEFLQLANKEVEV